MTRKVLTYFRSEAREIVQGLSEDLLAFERDQQPEVLSRMLRLAHTLKGAARVVKQKSIAEHIHEFEDLLSPYREVPDGCSKEQIDRLLKLIDNISVLLDHLDEETSKPTSAEKDTARSSPRAASLPSQPAPLWHHRGLEVESLLEDLRAASGQLDSMRESMPTLEKGKNLGDLLLSQLAVEGVPKAARYVAEELRSLLGSIERHLAAGMEQLERELKQVQENTEKLRLVKAEALFPTLRRALREAVSESGAQVELTTEGGDLRLDGSILAVVQGALIQAVRNSVAHGLQTSAERSKLGKPEPTQLSISVSRIGRDIVFVYRDDGRGINIEAVRERMSERGMNVKGADQAEILRLLLQGGISTAGSVTQEAGRGVGLELIGGAAADLGGRALIRTERDRYTEITMQFPWSVAGMNLLEVSAQLSDPGERQTFLLPLDCVREVLSVREIDVLSESNGNTVLYQGQAVRLLSLSGILGAAEYPSSTVVVLESPDGMLALAVAGLQGTRTASLLALPPFVDTAEYIAGAVLDADAGVLLALDPKGLSLELERYRAPRKISVQTGPPLLVIDDSLTTRMLQQSILESAGFEVDLATSAEEGLEKAAERSYGLILVDVEMPGIDGFTFVERIRSDPALAHIPAILVTSRDTPEDKARGRAVGAQGYMVKSEYDQKRLLDTIRGLLP